MSLVRADRIKALVEWATTHKVLSANMLPFDAIYQKALGRYPFLHNKTIRSYTEATLRIINVARKQKGGVK